MKLTKKEKKKEYSSFPVIAEINSLIDELKDSNANDKSVPGGMGLTHIVTGGMAQVPERSSGMGAGREEGEGTLPGERGPSITEP